MISFAANLDITSLQNYYPMGDSYSPFYAPFTLNINPISGAGLIKKVKKIEYIWDDGNTTVVDYVPSTIPNYSLPFPFEVGNPLNKKVSNTFYSKLF